jgi:hypothetical protein
MSYILLCYTRNSPVLGRWFEFQPLVWLSLSHFGVEGHPNHFWAGQAESIPFRRRRPPRPYLGRSGSVCLIPASKATITTSGPVGLCLSHSGVEDHQDHFWAGRAVPFSFRRRKVAKTASGPLGPYLTHSGVEELPRPLLGRSGRI